ncbi:N-acetyl sugar amidotransferase [Pelagibacteraceae bacterium]|nr:N-acetyl sugar amidotransferase [Pelagibacteraceae bacterium]
MKNILLKKNLKLDFYKLSNESHLEKQLATLPETVKFCKKCVISNQRPRIVFDEKGICGPCNWFEEKKKIDWNSRKKQFENLLDKYRKKNGEYDVIVPGSGGKDSGMIAHLLKYKYNMNPLYVTWSPLLYTDIGIKNLQNLYNSGIDGKVFTPNREMQRKISLLGLIFIGNHFEAFGRGQMCYPFHVAKELNIKLVMYGENGELEYGGSLENKDKSGASFSTRDKIYHKGTSTKELLKCGLEKGIVSEKDMNQPSLKYYALPKIEDIEKIGIEMAWYGYFNNWIPQENFYYAAKNYNFEVNPLGRSEGTYNKYASLDDVTDPLHYYMSYIKFGIGRSTSDAAHEIRDGHITREEGVQLVKTFDHEKPSRSLQATLNYLNITLEDLDAIVDGFRDKRPNLWKKTNQDWELKHAVYK